PVTLGTLEHQVLEEVGEASAPELLVAAADSVEDCRCDQRGLAIAHQADLEAVGEPSYLDGTGQRGRAGARGGRSHPVCGGGDARLGAAQLPRRRPPACGRETEIVVGLAPPGCALIRIR